MTFEGLPPSILYLGCVQIPPHLMTSSLLATCCSRCRNYILCYIWKYKIHCIDEITSSERKYSTYDLMVFKIHAEIGMNRQLLEVTAKCHVYGLIYFLMWTIDFGTTWGVYYYFSKRHVYCHVGLCCECSYPMSNSMIYLFVYKYIHAVVSLPPPLLFAHCRTFLSNSLAVYIRAVRYFILFLSLFDVHIAQNWIPLIL